jgi:hypothetical protein
MKQNRRIKSGIMLLMVVAISFSAISIVATSINELAIESNNKNSVKECHFHETGLNGVNWQALPASHIQVLLGAVCLVGGLLTIGIFAVLKTRKNRICVLDSTKLCDKCGKCYNQ